MDDTKNTALNPSGDNTSSPLTPSNNPGSSTPSFHSDIDVPPPPAEPAGGLGSPAPFSPPVVHEEVSEPTPTPSAPTAPFSPEPQHEAPVTHPPLDEHPAEPVNTTNSSTPLSSPGGGFGGLPPVITPPQKPGKGKMFAAIAGIVLLLISIPVGVILVRQNLELREKAAPDWCAGHPYADQLPECSDQNAPDPSGPEDMPPGNEDPAPPADDGGGGGGDEGNYSDQDQKISECIRQDCDGDKGLLVCVDTWQRPDGSTYEYAGSVVGECQKTPITCETSCPSGYAGTCGGHDYHNGLGCQCETQNQTCTRINECSDEGGSCVGSSGICSNQGGYTSDASCGGGGICCMGAAGSASDPNTPVDNTPESGNTDGATGGTSGGENATGGTVGSGDCIATIAFTGVDQSWRQPAGSPVTVCAPTSNSVSLTMTVTLPNHCPAQTVTWNETNATCTGTNYSMCPGPAETPCSATPVQKAGQVVGGAPLTQTIQTTSPSCGSAQIDFDNIRVNGTLLTNGSGQQIGEGIRAFQNNCGPNQCVALKVYKYPYDAGYLVTNVNSLKPGDAVKFCVAGAGGTPQIQINGGSSRAAQENGPDGQKCLQYDIPSDATTLRVTGSI